MIEASAQRKSRSGRRILFGYIIRLVLVWRGLLLAAFLPVAQSFLFAPFPPSVTPLAIKRRRKISNAPRRASSSALAAEGSTSTGRMNDGSDGKSNEITSRRRALFRGALLVVAAGTIAGSTTLIIPSLASAAATTEQDLNKPSLVSRDRVAELLSAVPTFTIVDKQGAPFLVVGEDAKPTGYFFVDYNEASRIRKLATDSASAAINAAKKDGSYTTDMTNPWQAARISTVPLDTAVALSLRSGKGSAIRNYFQVAASVADIEDALQVTGKDDLPEGKVPMFYYEDFTLSDSSSSTPLYFSKLQLESAYKKQNPGQPLPDKVAVTELFAVLTAMVEPGGTDKDLQNLVFVAPIDSAKYVQQCQRTGGKEAPFLLGQSNIVL